MMLISIKCMGVKGDVVKHFTRASTWHPISNYYAWLISSLPTFDSLIAFNLQVIVI